MRTRKIVQSVSAGIVLGGEAIGALLLHESRSLAITAPTVIVAIVLTVWLLDSGLDLFVKKSSWAANWLGVKPASKVKVHGYWYSAIRDREGKLLGGSIFLIRAGLDAVDFAGNYQDRTVTPPQWTWWEGSGAPFGDEAILYGYRGVEDDKDDDGCGMYSFPSGSPETVRGSFYGNSLPAAEGYRSANGERVPKFELTSEFTANVESRKQALVRYLDKQPESIGGS